MRVYEVRPGDSPASIAIEYAGCPKCVIDLVRANPHKQAVVHPNGFTTFKSLLAGEKLNLPDKWASKLFDDLPSTYFAALPHPDGVTPGKFGVGAAGTLGDYATLDAARTKMNALKQVGDQAFGAEAASTADLIDQSVREAAGSTNPGIGAYVQAVHMGTDESRKNNADFIVAIDAGDQTAANSARIDVQNALAEAFDAAQLLLQTVYGAAPSTPVTPPIVVVPVPTPIPSWTPPPPKPKPHPSASPPQPVVVAPEQPKGLSTGAVLGVGLLGVGAVGGAIYYATSNPQKTRRQLRRYL